MAEVVTCKRKEAYLQSLVENIARTKPGSMDFARELKRLTRYFSLDSAEVRILGECSRVYSIR